MERTCIKTKYRHVYNADGTKRAEPCAGLLGINSDHSGTYTMCGKCGEGWRFEFAMGLNSGSDFAYQDVPKQKLSRRRNRR
jgi:hypothetical protein